MDRWRWPPPPMTHRSRSPPSWTFGCRRTAPPTGSSARLLGRPLHRDELEHQRLGKPTALAVFASDNLSSSAYATEEILHVLIPPSAWPRSRSSCPSPSPCSWCSAS